MNPGQKIATAVVVGIIVVLTGAYALLAVERGDEAPAGETTDTQAMAPSDTIAAVIPLHIEATSPEMTAVTPRRTSTIASTSSDATIKSEASMIPAGTTVDVKIQTHISSRTAKVGDRVEAVTINNVMVDNKIAIPAGTAVIGQVSEVRPAAETKSAAVLKITFSRIGDHATRLTMVTPDLEARARTANRAVDAGLVIGGAVAGGVIGNQTDAKHGTEIGAVVGGVAGGVAAANIGANVQLKLGENATLKFTDNVSL